jgi:prevent-host-death family protein
MTSYTASRARKEFYGLVDQVSLDHEPVLITGKRNNAILVSEEDWRSIQETLYLMRVPGMSESIREGLETPPKKMSKALKW